MPDIIKHTDIAEAGALKPFQDELIATIKILQNLEKQIISIAKTSKSNLSGLKPDSYENIKKIGEETAKVNKVFTESEIIAKERIKTQAKFDQTITKEIKELNELKVDLAKKNQQAKEDARLTASSTGAYEKLSIKLNQLRRAYKDLSAAGLEGAASSKVLLKEIQALDTKLKETDASVGQHQRNVGNYSSAFDNLGGAAGRVVGSFKGILGQFKAMMANPVVLTFVAITAALKGMWEGIKMSDDGLTEMDAQMAKMGATSDVLLQRLGEFGKGLAKLLTGQGKEGIKQMAGAFTDVGDQLYYAQKAAYEFTYAMDAIEDSATAFISTEAELRKSIAENLFKSKDQTLAVRERMAALKQAQTDSKTIVAFKANEARELYEAEFNRINDLKRVNRNFLRYIIETDHAVLAEKLKTSTSLQRAYNKIGDESIKHLEELRAGVFNAEAAFFEENKRSQAALTGFQKEEAEKRAAAHKKYLETIRDLNDEFRQSEIDLIKSDTERQREQIEFNLQKQIRAIYEKYGLSKKSADLAMNLTRKAEQEQADLIKAKANDEKVTMIDMDNARKKNAEAVKEANKKRKTEEQKEEKALQDKAFQVVKDYADRRNRLKLEAIDKEINAAQKREDKLREIAAKGAQNAEENLAYEKRRQAELEAQRDRQIKKQMQQEKALAIIKALASGNYKDVNTIKGLGSAFASYFEGTEDTGPGGNVDDKGGMIAVLHPGERVMTREQNKKVGDLTNEQAATVLDLYNKGHFLSPAAFDKVPEASEQNAWLQINELKKVQAEIQNLRTELKNRPSSSMGYDVIKQVVIETVKTQYKETRTEKKTGGLYGN